MFYDSCKNAPQKAHWFSDLCLFHPVGFLTLMIWCWLSPLILVPSITLHRGASLVSPCLGCKDEKDSPHLQTKESTGTRGKTGHTRRLSLASLKQPSQIFATSVESLRAFSNQLGCNLRWLHVTTLWGLWWLSGWTFGQPESQALWGNQGWEGLTPLPHTELVFYILLWAFSSTPRSVAILLVDRCHPRRMVTNDGLVWLDD